MNPADRPIWNFLADLAGAREEDKPDLVRRAFAWQVAAERRRIGRALRNLPLSDYNSGNDRARLVYIDDALECVKAPRQVRAMTGGGERR